MDKGAASIFRGKKANPSKLVRWGFQAKGADYLYSKTLPDSGFQLTVRITGQGEVATEIIDPVFQEPYTLHLVDSARGGFVGSVRKQYEDTLTEIATHCFDKDVFQSPQAKELMEYVSGRYGDELEYLWSKFPNNAIWRRKDTGKWYAALLTVSKRKLGLSSDEVAEIIDLRMDEQERETLVDHTRYFPGYHMNKTHWYTIILDHSVPTEEICRRVDVSYRLAKK